MSICNEDILTFERLQKDVSHLSKAFISIGIEKGDIIPICLPPCNEGIILFFAINSIGAVSTFINAAISKGELMSYQEKYKSKIMILKDNSETIKIVRHEENEEIEYSAFFALGQKNEKLPQKVFSKDEAFICYTSGTTGEPKAIVLTNENLMSSMLALRKTTHMQLGPKGKCLQVVPFNYPYGFIISTLFPMYVGKTAALTPNIKLDDVVKWIKKYRPKYIQAIPAFYREMMRQLEGEKLNLSFLKYEVSGGDTLDIETKAELKKFNKQHKCNAKICDGSGNGEGCGCLTTSVVLGKSNWKSVGKPIKGLNVKVIDPDTRKELGYNQTGVLCFSGKMIMKGYFGDSESTRKVLIPENGEIWFHTDTYAHIEKKGWVCLDGRDRRFFITFDDEGSPYKVYCDYIQSVINSVPLVNESAVVKKKDGTRGYVPVAFVRLIKDAKFGGLDEIRRVCRDKLDRYAVPVEWHIVSALPLTAAGKVDYLALEKMG